MSAPAPKRNPIPFGKYLLLDRINIGGMAEVWRGKAFGAGGFERLVAIKRILPSIAEDEEFTAMFIDEAKISVQLSHANIAQTYDLGQISGTYYIAMEYVAGRDLRAVFDRARKRKEMLPLPLVCHVMSKVCEGLDHAHRKKDGAGRDLNIVHRDVSPQNLLLSYDGEVKVIDFGIAKAAGRANKTQAGILKGKFGYMSPEQILGRPLDRRTDIFALGVCLHELLCGQRLFTGESDYSVLEKVRNVDIRRPSELNAEIPAALEAIVLRALAREPSERYAHASDMAEDLQRFLLTSGHYFGRKDLMQFMRTTFAEDLEKEEVRQLEYASVRSPQELQAKPGEAPSADPGPTEPRSGTQPRAPLPEASGPLASRGGGIRLPFASGGTSEAPSPERRGGLSSPRAELPSSSRSGSGERERGASEEPASAPGSAAAGEDTGVSRSALPEVPATLPRIGGGRRSPPTQGTASTRSPRIGGGSSSSGALTPVSPSAALTSPTPAPTSRAAEHRTDDALPGASIGPGPTGSGASGASRASGPSPAVMRDARSPTPGMSPDRATPAATGMARDVRSATQGTTPDRTAPAASGDTAADEQDGEAQTLAMPTAFGLGAAEAHARFHLPVAQGDVAADSGQHTALDLRPIAAPEAAEAEADSAQDDDTLPKGRPALVRNPPLEASREEQRKTDPDLHGMVGQAMRASSAALRSTSSAQLPAHGSVTAERPVLVPLPAGMAAPGEPSLTRADRPPRASGAREGIPAPARSAAREAPPAANELTARLRELFDARELRHSRRDLWLAGLGGVVLALLLKLLGSWFGGPPPMGLVVIDVSGVPAHLATVRVDGEALPGPLQFPMKAEVPVGRSRIEVSAAGFRPSAHEIEVASPGSVSEVRATLEPLTRNVP